MRASPSKPASAPTGPTVGSENGRLKRNYWREGGRMLEQRQPSPQRLSLVCFPWKRARLHFDIGTDACMTLDTQLPYTYPSPLTSPTYIPFIFEQNKSTKLYLRFLSLSYSLRLNILFFIYSMFPVYIPHKNTCTSFNLLSKCW